MIQRELYVRYLLSTPINRTCTNLADHLDGVSHDSVSDFLRQKRVTARDLWRLVEGLISDGPDACLIVDDSVQDKRYARFTELVKRQYSGAVGGLVRGIGVVNLVHSAGPQDPAGDFFPIDYRIYAPDVDGKTKNAHFREMLLHAVADKRVQARTVLFDAWYAAVANLKLVHRVGLTFSTTLKANRLVSLSPQTGYGHLDALDWTAESLEHGLSVKLKELPVRVRLFKVVATNGDIDWVITNDLDEPLTTPVAQATSDVRWQAGGTASRPEATHGNRAVSMPFRPPASAPISPVAIRPGSRSKFTPNAWAQRSIRCAPISSANTCVPSYANQAYQSSLRAERKPCV